MTRFLTIDDLHANVGEKEILSGIDLTINHGEIHALMGPNRSGKSTLAGALMGHPGYRVTKGRVSVGDTNLLGLEAHERSLLGVFLAFQYPVEIPGVTVGKLLKRAVELRSDDKVNVSRFIKEMRNAMDFLEMDHEFINRYVNQGFSGGEKKRMEILQMMLLKPSLAILDETDSGLDIDALKIVAKGVNALRGEKFTALVITHYKRILDHINPDFVHVMHQGRIVTSGGPEVSSALEQRGYEWIKGKYAAKEATHG